MNSTLIYPPQTIKNFNESDLKNRTQFPKKVINDALNSQKIIHAKTSPKNFWSKHCIVVAVDVSEILDRVFCNCGLVDAFQEAFTLTALDRRLFAPPIENQWQRLVNMANTCETFHMNPQRVAHLINQGFKSVTLLSMAKEARDDPGMDKLKNCLSVLNDRRLTPLEPLHSLRRLLQTKRKQVFSLKHFEFLDLANVAPRKKLPLNRDYKLPQPMIAKSTFKNHDTATMLGPRPSCSCFQDDHATTRLLPPPSLSLRRDLLFSTVSSSSGYSSGSSSSMELPDSPDSVKKPNFHLESAIISTPPPSMTPQRSQYQPQRQPTAFPFRRSPFIRPHTPLQMLKGDTMNGSGDTRVSLQRTSGPFKVHCPRPDCNWFWSNHQVEDHCLKAHRISKEAVARISPIFTESRQHPSDYSQTQKRICGEVKLNLNIKEVLDVDNKIQLWWGPIQFIFDNVTFYLIVYKKIDPEKPEPQILFWIWTALSSQEAGKYRYEIHLENNRGQQTHNAYYNRPFIGTVQSLEVSHTDLIQRHMKCIVYFTPSYIRKTYLRFNNRNLHHQPPPKMLDMNYTVKIMRQSL